MIRGCGYDFRRMRRLPFALLFLLAMSAQAAPKAKAAAPCTVPASVLDIYPNIDKATAADWNAARTSTRAVIAACMAAPPKEMESRDRLYALLKQEMLVFYDP